MNNLVRMFIPQKMKTRPQFFDVFMSFVAHPRRKQTRPNEKAMFYMEYTSTSYPVTLECKLVAACKAIKRTQ